MGVINHNAIIATTWDEEAFDKAVEWVKQLEQADRELFLISTNEVINGYRTIVMMPDGSKEGWNESNHGDKLRDEFTALLRTFNYKDGSSPWDWVEVGFGEYGQMVLCGNNKNCYSREKYYHG